MHLKYLGIPAWMPADAQTNDDVSNVHVQWISHWKIKADDHDNHEMMSQGSLMLFREGTIKRRAHLNLRAVAWVY